MAEPARRGEQRKTDTLAILEAQHADVWVATASPDGVPHLVPLSFAWDGTHVVLVTEAGFPTTRNLRSSGRARLGFGATRNVVMVEATLVDATPVAEVGVEVGELYARQSDWDPRDSRGEFIYFRLRPRTIQAWREANELEGRTLMRDGAWLY